jgi:hypothetical protein
MSFTYSELKQAIQDYAENTETSFVNNLPVFIRNAEERILKTVQLNLFRRNVTASLTSGNRFLAMPDDFLASYSLSLTSAGDKFFLDHKDVNFLEEYWPDNTDTGRPRYYAEFTSDNFVLAPTPDAAYQVELHYFYRPASVTSLADSGKSWLSDNAPYAMLYGSLTEAYVYMKGEADVFSVYDAKFAEAVARLKDLGEAKQTGDAYRDGQVILPKT